MTTRDRVLGAYQIFGGVCSLAMLWPTMMARGTVAVAALAGFSALAIGAGLSLWRGGSNRWQLTLFNQLVQVVGFYTPWAAFTISHGAAITVSNQCFAKATFADSTFHSDASVSLVNSVCDVLVGRTAAGLPTFGLSLNFVALGLVLYAMVAAHRTARTPAPDSAPPSAAETQP